MNNEIQKPHIADFISAVSEKQIGLKDDKFIYIDTKKEVEQKVIDEAKTLQDEQFGNLLRNELDNLCAEKDSGAKKIIAKKYLSDYQLGEYNSVAELLNDDNITFFDNEAKVFGTTAQDEYNKAKAIATQYKDEYYNFLSLIRAFRRKTEKLIDDNELDKAKEAIEKAKDFNADTTIDDIVGLFKVAK